MENNEQMNSTEVANNSTNFLKQNSASESQEFKKNSFINQLNIANNEPIKEDALSTNANINQDEEKNIDINSLKNNSNINPKPTNTFTEKLKISNEIKSVKYKNKLQQYLQSGYKKYPHAKNSRYLIQHYKHWEGHNYFPFSGHIIEGPCAFRPTLATGVAVTLPTALFIVFNADFITNTWTKAILITGGVICLIVLTFLILSSFRDPGIIRRNHFSRNFLFERKASKIVHLGYLRSYKYCGTCSIMRPIRSSHCFDCDNCVEKCDHHCPWIGNCVGKRNYIYFYFFVVTFTILLVYIEGFCVAHIWKYLYDEIKKNDKLSNNKKRDHIVAVSLCDLIMSMFLIIYGIVCLAFVLGLLFYHTKLVCTNTTTKEMLKKLWNNPFGNGYNRNMEYNVINTLDPEIKKYSILDILRNGKENDFEYKEFEKQKLFQQEFNYHNLNPDNLDNHNLNDLSNNYLKAKNGDENNNINNNNINNNRRRKVFNIDPNNDDMDDYPDIEKNEDEINNNYFSAPIDNK